MKKYGKKKKYFFASIKSKKKGVGSGVGSGSISQRYGPGDPDPHQNVTDPQHCFKRTKRYHETRKNRIHLIKLSL
jgi:hypothetical protein